MRAVRIHDTLSGGVRPLEPRDDARVSIYACGPTVYAPIHVGNARPYVVFSLLKRFLEQAGYDVTLFGLGGEGILRTFGRDRAASQVITRALDQGVAYCDTAPAYAGSIDYYGATLGERRKQIFLSSKKTQASVCSVADAPACGSCWTNPAIEGTSRYTASSRRPSSLRDDVSRTA